MKIRTTINKNTYNVLKMFGDIDTVTNKILALGAQGVFFDIMRKPPALIDYNNCIKVSINITEPEYLSLVNTYGIHSSLISISRLLEWFVDEEMYDICGFIPSQEYITKRRDKIMLYCANAQTYSLKLITLLNGDELCNKALEAYECLTQLEEEYGKRTNKNNS